MARLFEELDSSSTPMGTISLRRRLEPSLKVDVFEVKLDDEFLMSSLFTVAEVELARLGLAAHEGADLDVAVGGLGLGYTAFAALQDSRVGSLLVIEALAEVIDWHERRLLPETVGLVEDARTRLVLGDFFALVAGEDGLDPQQPGRTFDVVLLDVDHSPRHVLHPSHAPFYEPAGLEHLARQLRPGGVFALWSDDPPDEAFREVLAGVFATVEAHVVTFPNFYLGEDSANTVYLASR